MKTILLATRNKDKYRIISKLLSTENFKNYDFLSLNDINDEIINEKEIGNVLERSYQKAINAFNSLKDKSFDYIIGIDDGIKMKGQMIENVKEYINAILDDKYLEENEKIQIVRAYTFFNKEGKNKSIVTEIPFKYVKLKESFKLEENSYPLSHVMAPLNSNKSVFELNDDETNQYYLDYSKEEFKKVELYFNDK